MISGHSSGAGMDEKEEQFRIMYKIAIEDLKFAKKQQWQTIYVTLSAIGALVYAYTKIDENVSCVGLAEFVIAYLITYLTGFFGITLIWIQHFSISWYRKKKNKYLNKFAEEVRCVEIGHSNEDRATSDADTWFFTNGFTLAVFVAVGVAGWIMRSVMQEAVRINSGLFLFLWLMGLVVGWLGALGIAKKFSRPRH